MRLAYSGRESMTTHLTEDKLRTLCGKRVRGSMTRNRAPECFACGNIEIARTRVEARKADPFAGLPGA